MANKILTDVGWQQRVRDKLGTPVAYLSDDAIEQPDVIDVAEANLISMFPDYATYSGTKLMYLKSAIVCECAILICPTMPARLPKREQGPHFTKDDDMDWFKMLEQLTTDKYMLIGKISGVDYGTDILHFGLTYDK